MAIDNKYGRVTLEHGNIGDDEPVVVFRAQDKLLPKVLAYYRLFCWKAGSPAVHLALIDDTLRIIERWQKHNNVKVPESAGHREGITQ